MFILEDFSYYNKKYRFLTKEDQCHYNKIKNFHYGKSCSPIIHSENILFLGIESIIDVIIFHQSNPTSYIYIFGYEKNIFPDIEISNVIFLDSLHNICDGNIIYDAVKVTKEFCNSAENRNYLFRLIGNKLYGDYESINIPPLELFVNIRNKFNMFYLVDEVSNRTISGYLKNNDDSDISIIISGGELNDDLKDSIIYLMEKSELSIDVIVCPLENDRNIDYEFIFKNKINLIESRANTYSGAWSRGFEASNSEYVFFMYSEDMLSKEIFDELYLLSITTHADIAKSGYRIFENRNLTMDDNLTDSDKYGVISNPNSLLKAPLTPWGKLYNSDFLNGIGLKKEYLFEEEIFSFLTISAADIISSLPDKYYIRNNINKEINDVKKIGHYEVIYNFIRPYASMEVMNTLLELEIKNYYKIISINNSEPDSNIDKLFTRLFECYGDRYRLQEKIISLRP